MSGPAISLQHVTVRLGGHAVLNSVSFDVEPGTIHAIIGPNGAGKSTLVNAILGLVAHQGTIRFATPRPRVGYAPQSVDIDRSLPLTLRDMMALMTQRRPAFLGRSRSIAARVDAALEDMGLTHRRDALFGALSGGERQRLLFAQALIFDPDLLILDEPTANMDDAGTALVERKVAGLAAGGTTILWINHDLAQVRRLADTVTALQGHVEFSGCPSDMPAARLAPTAQVA